MLHTLKKFINEIMLERLDTKTLQSMVSPEEIIDYAETNLKKIGKGGGRDVYVLSSSKVLKIGMTSFGRMQNRVETRAFSNTNIRPIVTKIFESDPDGKWIISELVKPFQNEAEIDNFLGGDGSFNFLIDTCWRARKNPTEASQTMKTLGEPEETIELAFNLARAFNQGLGIDVQKWDQWGYNADRKIVLLDSGVLGKKLETSAF